MNIEDKGNIVIITGLEVDIKEPRNTYYADSTSIYELLKKHYSQDNKNLISIYANKLIDKLSTDELTGKQITLKFSNIRKDWIIAILNFLDVEFTDTYGVITFPVNYEGIKPLIVNT